MNTRTADQAEIDKFAALAAEWWDPEGPLKTLHEMNPLRMDYLGTRIALHGAKVLDVACGGGLLAEALTEEGASVTGIDLAAAAIDTARFHAMTRNLSIQYECVDTAELALRRRGEFDIVTCFEALEHVPNPAVMVAACAAALRPGGAAFFSTINRTPKSFLFAIVAAEHALRWVPRGTHEYAKLVRPSELGAWCRHAGLEVRELTGMHVNPLNREYSLGGDVDVNYFAWATKPAPTDA